VHAATSVNGIACRIQKPHHHKAEGNKRAPRGITTNSKHANAQQLQVEGAFEVYRLHGGTKCASHGHVRQMLAKNWETSKMLD
jgi:hypothetical protein